MALKKKDVLSNKRSEQTPAAPASELSQRQINEKLTDQLLSMQEELVAIKLGIVPQDPGGQMAEVIKALRERSDEEKFGGAYTRAEDINPEDALSAEEAVTFFAYQSQYFIVDDKRNGREVRTPYYTTLHFKYESSRVQKSGKDNNIFSMSTYVCRSKREVEWLRNHTHYNALFFDKQKSELGEDAVYATIVARVMTSLNGMGQIQIVALAKQHGIPLTQDIRSMRVQVASMQAKKQMADAKEVSMNVIAESRKDLLVLQSDAK